MIILHHIAAALLIAWHYFCGHIAEVLASTIIPTLLAGLVNRPGASDNKLVALLKLAVRFCGWAKHYDEPGSVKLPLGELLALAWRGVVAVYRVFKPAPAALLLVVISLTANGCALSTTPAGATTAQKLKADMDAIAQAELDVKTQCGANFAPLAVQAGAALSIAEAAANAYAGNIAGAVAAAAVAYPALEGDVQGIACVVRVLQTDYQKYKPSKAAWLMRFHSLEASAAREQIHALMEVPPVCDTGTEHGSEVCRPVTVDDDVPAVVCPMTAARAAARPALVRQ